jgi:release factor glutamine methyltransferase
MAATERVGVSAGEALRWARERLGASVESPRVDAELLVRHVLSVRRGELLAHPERALTPAEHDQLLDLVDRRRAGEPLQYLTGTQAFRSLELAVGPGVLVPRPETEFVVERALARLAGVPDPIVVDVGAGSGAICLAIGTERPDARVWATEVSAEAMAWARRNVAGVENVDLLEGDLFDPLPWQIRKRVDLIVSNPPYLSEAELEEARVDVRDHEPRVATVSGPTGLEVPHRLVTGAAAWLRPGAWLVIETSPVQSARLEALMRACYEQVAVVADLAGRLRVAEGRAPGPA